MSTETSAREHDPNRGESPAADSNAKVAREQLRVAIVTAGLEFAGAEKQTFYMARALAEAGVRVRVYHITNGGQYHDALRSLQIESTWLGRWPSPVFRLPFLLASLRSFRPHVIQSIHAYTNLYSSIAGRVLRAVSVGGLRGDLKACFADNGRFSRYLLTWPDAIAVNSRRAIEQIKQARLVDQSRLHFLPNVIDLDGYQECAGTSRQADGAECTCISVGRLLPAKRVDVFVRALAAARSTEPGLRGAVVGDGPETARLQKLAAELGLLPGALDFLGLREDIAAVLQQAAMFVFCSESEGTPNVILEAMAASLPVITTPAGDAADVVNPAGAGYVVPFGDVKETADAMVRLARSPDLRSKLGQAGREYVARHRATSELGERLVRMYADVARTSARGRRGNSFALRAALDRFKLADDSNAACSAACSEDASDVFHVRGTA
jgi:glycosyltransferase involved in cell wall biosynthesis